MEVHAVPYLDEWHSLCWVPCLAARIRSVCGDEPSVGVGAATWPWLDNSNNNNNKTACVLDGQSGAGRVIGRVGCVVHPSSARAEGGYASDPARPGNTLFMLRLVVGGNWFKRRRSTQLGK